MKVQVGVSNRHIHVTKEHYKILFGDKQIEKVRDLNQPGQFAANDFVTLKTEKSTIEKVRLIGPCREYTQVEISRTDAIKLGLNPPIRESGDLKGSSPITLVGPCGTVELEEGCIIADRHIHVDDEIIKYYHLEGVEKLNVFVNTPKGGVLANVHLKHSEKAYFELHLDTDDANGFMLKQGDIVDIL